MHWPHLPSGIWPENRCVHYALDFFCMPQQKNQSDFFQRVLPTDGHAVKDECHLPCDSSSAQWQKDSSKYDCPPFWDRSVHRHQNNLQTQNPQQFSGSFHQFFLYLLQTIPENWLLSLLFLGIPEISYDRLENPFLPDRKENPATRGQHASQQSPAGLAGNGYSPALAMLYIFLQSRQDLP